MNNLVTFDFCKTINWITYFLVIFGAINWGIIGVWNINLLELLFEESNLIVRIVSILVGLSGLRMVYLLCFAPYCDKCN